MSGSGPDVVRIKRKRYEQAPEALMVERPGKRQHTQDVHYVLKKDTTDASQGGLFSGHSAANPPATSRPSPSHAPGSGLDSPVSAIKERRIFHLKRPSTPEAGIKKRKTKDNEDVIATFIERRSKKNAQDLLHLAKGGNDAGASPAPADNLKRPGRGSAVRAGGRHGAGAPTFGGASTAGPTMVAVANSLNQFAMEEAAKEQLPPRPKVTAKPKLPPQRSRELHQQRIADKAALDHQRDTEMDMDDDADYVYDTYVLAPVPQAGNAQVSAQDSGGNVGYLVITEEDQAAWETYIEDDPSDKDWDSNEDDENAEDWYGADYPDDEVASDDEYGRNAYGYRAHGSDNEEWDADTGNFSDDEYERQMNPWRKKIPEKFSGYLTGAVKGVAEDEDED
ncbi:hypothetical protein CLAFUW4_05995 [Fulvia fulva]|uniref:Transcription factor Iwr1 domain-containing protein n=1 Tax=Passalora fulva TaxID=5499 RepID=A0A9Q8LHZ7_PASFU|nr:uncharacterized protein CLAFUR5_06139 [Fulvia fulva]KAK4623861.1 hypothetical protein CLAFUR4_06000 [Fulvia fulva]KAK4624858.1 hypothetical protein CLAFUR0_06003 [Fulvia fulva]UJO17840.1 hypothetical protein CLAFUR5_06139 [Fulvia fulva]WPV15594.1 hypothetical protein CLAFUW4_05995 [Fulvia fulva]WPV29861.1 hypothetical protein CLAFUW7_05993 [Fulvia fulva]